MFRKHFLKQQTYTERAALLTPTHRKKKRNKLQKSSHIPVTRVPSRSHRLIKNKSRKRQRDDRREISFYCGEKIISLPQHREDG